VKTVPILTGLSAKLHSFLRIRSTQYNDYRESPAAAVAGVAAFEAVELLDWALA
jgi:hypothetical protein